MAFTLPRPLSHSSISMFQECPQKYKFKYIDKIPEKPRHFFSFGQSVHLALEFFYGVKTLPAPSLEELLAFYKENWVEGGYKDPGQEAQYFEDGKAILNAFYKKHIRDYALPFFVEYNFNLEVEGVPVTGKVDRIDKLPDGTLSILDYKTGKALAGKRAQTDAQLTMYQLAAEHLLGMTVGKLVFYHLPTLKEQTVERHPAELVDGLRQRIVSTAEQISAGRFEPQPAESVCRWCDFKPLCPIFKSEYSTPQPPPLDAELSAKIDRYGDLLGEAESLKGEILASLAQKGYVRAFGRRFEASRAAKQKWEFSDKQKILEIIKKSGLYDRVLAPSAPKVEALLSDPTVDGGVRAQLEEFGRRVETPDLKVKPL